jgi:hypothetical protein
MPDLFSALFAAYVLGIGLTLGAYTVYEVKSLFAKYVAPKVTF